MKTVETENEGLKRAYTLTISASEIESRVDQEVKRVAPQVRMQGFRPGKVPPNLIRKMHGEALRQDALNSAVQESVQKLLADNQLRPAMQPEVELDEGYEPGKDAEVRVRLETLPEVPKPQIDGLELERLTVEPDPAVIDEQIERLAQGQKKWDDAPEGHAAETGNLVVVDFAGKVDGEAFDGGSGEAMPVEIGSGQLIPGFEDQLIGAKVGEERTLKVQFPDDYPAANLKGKPATFDITVKEVKVAGETKIDDEFAKTLGLSGLEQLRPGGVLGPGGGYRTPGRHRLRRKRGGAGAAGKQRRGQEGQDDKTLHGIPSFERGVGFGWFRGSVGYPSSVIPGDKLPSQDSGLPGG